MKGMNPILHYMPGVGVVRRLWRYIPSDIEPVEFWLSIFNHSIGMDSVTGRNDRLKVEFRGSFQSLKLR